MAFLCSLRASEQGRLWARSGEIVNDTTLLTKILTPCIKLMTLIAGSALVGMLFVSGGDIIGRTLFDSPIESSSNIISELLFPTCVFFSLPYLASISALQIGKT